MFILYFAFASFYRASSREIKRIDSVLRSFIYTVRASCVRAHSSDPAHLALSTSQNYGEMLSGMASVRAYQQQELFVRKTEHSIDLENRAYFLTVSSPLLGFVVYPLTPSPSTIYQIALQRWLGVRLDFLGNILVLGIGLFGVGFREVRAAFSVFNITALTLSSLLSSH
jgi:ATP-binding cassette, subfamily C (CFTR/MRP), member 1